MCQSIKTNLIEIEDLCRLVCDAVHSGSSVTTLAGEHAVGIITADKKSALSKHVLDTGELRIAASFLQFPLKHLCTSTRLHGFVYQKTFIFGATGMRT